MKKGLIYISSLFLVACTNIPSQYEEGEYFLKKDIEKLESLLSKGKSIDTTVSKVAVEWHLDHTLKTISVIYDSLESSKPENYKSEFDFMRTVVLFTGKIPRGVAQSPPSVRPPEVILNENVLKQIEEVKEKMNRVIKLSEDANFNHPRFGMLNRDETLRFLEVHTNHHLNIIEDILKE